MSGAVDVIVVGAGVAGLSLAAELSAHNNVLVAEAEAAAGFHASGRSATFSHYGVGTPPVRLLTRLSRRFFESPPSGFCDVPLSATQHALFVAREKDRSALSGLGELMAPFAPIVEASADEMRRLAPALRLGGEGVVAGLSDPTALRIDVDVLLQAYLKQIRRNGSVVQLDCAVEGISFAGGHWFIETKQGAFSAPIIVNAAGAWADDLAIRAGVRPLGLAPLRRTIIVLDAPPGRDVRSWPFVRTAVDEFVMLPQGPRLLASALDETPSPPCDAQPDEYDVALAAARVEEYTDITVARIAGSWAGLRTFAPDRTPVAGFAPDAPGFFWFAGQGGYGVQTAPAAARAAAALILDGPWPAALDDMGVAPAMLAPSRLDGKRYAKGGMDHVL